MQRPQIKTLHHNGSYPLAADRPPGWYFMRVWQDHLEGPFGPYESEEAACAHFEALEGWLARELAAAAEWEARHA